MVGIEKNIGRTMLHVAYQGGLKITMYQKIAMNFWSSCFNLLSAEVIGMFHHICITWGSTPGHM